MKRKFSNIVRNSRTDYLFSKMNFIIGAGSVFNISGNYYQYDSSESEIESDTIAIENDWRNVGDDILQAKECVLNQ